MRSFALAVVLLAPIAAQAQNVDAGQQAFKVCRMCHDVGPGAQAKIGPPLNGLFGRKAGSLAGFVYSSAMRTSGLTWNDASFSTYMTNPRATVRGTSMSFGGIDDPQRIADLGAYLKQFDANGNIIAPGAQASAAATESASPKGNPATLECLRGFGSADPGKACALVGGDLLQAIGALVSGEPAKGYGGFNRGVLIDRGEDNGRNYVRRLRPSSTDPCLVEETAVFQDRTPNSAALGESTYNFRSITGVRYMLKDSDYANGVSVNPDDPGVAHVVFEGAAVLCRGAMAIDPTSDERRACDHIMVVRVEGTENRPVAMRALAIVRDACGWPK
jgi:cytochrome c